jgi:hypothetical protein
LSKPSRGPYLWALGLIWGLPIVLTVGGYAAMWLFFGPEDPHAEDSDRVDPGFLVVLVGAMAAPYLFVIGLAVCGAIALVQLRRRSRP